MALVAAPTGRTTIKQSAVSESWRCLWQGEVAVGNALGVRLPAGARLACAAVRVSAPTGKHTKAAANADTILIGFDGTAQAGGGWPLLPTHVTGQYIPVEHADQLRFDGYAAGDVVEVAIFG